MKLEQQVCSLDLAKRLKELGVDQLHSLFIYRKYSLREKHDIMFDPKRNLAILSGMIQEELAAFTVAELGEMLPFFLKDNGWLNIWKRNIGAGEVWVVVYTEIEMDGSEKVYFDFDSPTEADARAEMLIYLLENNLITL